VTGTSEAAARSPNIGFHAKVNRTSPMPAITSTPTWIGSRSNLHDRYELGDEPALVIEPMARRPFVPLTSAEDERDAGIVRSFLLPSAGRPHHALPSGAPHSG